MEMQVNSQEASLIEAFRRLPPDTAAEVSALTERLATLTMRGKVDWSDSWSDEDLKDFTIVSLNRLEDNEAQQSR
jgi:hypothetical protein